MAIILGIESTAHTFGIGIVRDGKVLANVRDMYTTESGGIIPLEAAKHHREVASRIYEKALKEAGIKESEIDVVAFSNAPGLAPCLIEGMKFAKELSKKLKKPIVGVNHCIAHLEIGGGYSAYPQARNSGAAKDPVMLYVSGANTQVISYEAGKYRIFGETLDLGVGNFIDTVARFMGLGFPGGPKIEELAKRSKYVELPYSVKGMDIALSGIQTNLKQKLEKGMKKEDLAYSLQETVFAMLVETAERVLAHTGKKELLLGGGVACNKRLVEMCRIMCEERGCKLFVPAREFLVDNGVMIAYLGEIMHNAGAKFDFEKIDIDARQRTDDVEVFWK